MLRQNWRFIARIERAGDIFITVIAFLAAYYGRASLREWNDRLDWGLPFEKTELLPLSDYAFVLVVALLVYAVTLQFLGAYERMRLKSSFELLRMFAVSSLMVFFILAGVVFLFKLDLSRTFIGLFCGLMVLCLTAERYIVLEVLRYFRKRGFNFRRVLVCGFGRQAVHLALEVSRRPELGLQIRCFADLREKGVISTDEVRDFRVQLRSVGVNRLGKFAIGKEAFQRALNEYAIDEVIFTDLVRVVPEVEEALLICSEQGVRTTLVADLFSLGMVKSSMSYFGELPLIHFQTPPGEGWPLTAKRLIDIVVSGALLLFLAPVFLVLALGVKFSSPGPVIFMQKRMGLNGRIFNLYKFRSMRLGAEKELARLQLQNEMNGPAFKMKRDPRVTKFGKFLRRYSLDELPQLWNVFKGDMSLVGPRPPVPGEVNSYQRRDRRRLSMRPGITCTWQVSGRNDIVDFESWVKLDLEYIDNWSLRRDFVLLARTIPAVLSGNGAR